MERVVAAVALEREVRSRPRPPADRPWLWPAPARPARTPAGRDAAARARSAVIAAPRVPRTGRGRRGGRGRGWRARTTRRGRGSCPAAAPKPDTIAGMPRSHERGEDRERAAGADQRRLAAAARGRARARAICSGGARGRSATGWRAPPSTSSSAPSGRASRSSASSAARDRRRVLAGREPHRQVAGGDRRDDRARLAAADAVDVERGVGAGAHVELGGGARRRPAARRPRRARRRRRGSVSQAGQLLRRSAARRRRAARPAAGRRGPGSTAASAACSAWKAFSAAPPYTPECAMRSPVRTSSRGEHDAARARR